MSTLSEKTTLFEDLAIALVHDGRCKNINDARLKVCKIGLNTSLKIHLRKHPVCEECEENVDTCGKLIRYNERWLCEGDFESARDEYHEE